MVWLAYAVSAEEHGVGRFGSIADWTSKGRRAGQKAAAKRPKSQPEKIYVLRDMLPNLRIHIFEHAGDQVTK
jgi:hypothetical protein